MVGILDDTCLGYQFGTRIKIAENYGTVRYVGELNGYTGTWLGIEWDDPHRGKHNGVVNGKRYFQTEHPTSASFILPAKVGLFQSVEEAAKQRYLSYTENILNSDLMRETKEYLHAPLFEVVGLEKLARKQSKFEQLTDVSVDNCPVNSAGYLKEFTMLTTLNLSHTLISNWQTVADICQQIPSLRNLNLSCNRFILPSKADAEKYSTAFEHLQSINLRNCNYTEWSQILQTARLWPNILYLSLQGNPIREISHVNTMEIFTNLRELDLQDMKITNFDNICKLGNLKTLVSLNLMNNGIEEIKLPDCPSNCKLDIFPQLEQLNLRSNPIWNDVNAFNELDKLAKLTNLQKTPHMKSNFDKMFAQAVAFISGLTTINKIQITNEERRGAEIDIWKEYAVQWLQASQLPKTLKDFYNKHRSYSTLIKKYGSPLEFIPRANMKISNLIKIQILNEATQELWEKRVPKAITVQALLGIIVKHFNLDCISCTPKLCYMDVRYPELIVTMDNPSKTLDFYSVQDNDTVLVQI